MRRIPVLAVVIASTVACSGSASTSSPTTPSSTIPASPAPAATPQAATGTYAVSGVVTDAAGHRGIAGAFVQVLDSANPTLTITDNAGVYAITGLTSGFVRVRASAAGYDAGEQIVDVGPANLRVDFGLRPLVPPAANFAGVWTGVYQVTECHDLDVPGLTNFHLCPQSSQSYQFTLTQIGTLVTGIYTMKSEFYFCACGGVYGDLPMSGSILSDGTLAITALGNGRGTVGATVQLDLQLRQASSATMTGAGTIHLRFGTPDDRSVGNVAIRSGSRAQ